MFIYFLLIFTCTAFSTSSAPSKHHRSEGKLTDLSNQLKRIETQFNKTMNELFEKIDDSTLDIINSLSFARISRRNQAQRTATPSLTALLIIDVQNDFINGSLAVRNCPSKHNGEEVVPIINRLLETIPFDVIVYSHDWHPSNHISFFDNLALRSQYLTKDSIPLKDLSLYSTATFSLNNLPRMEQTLWPRHCVQNTFGAKLHPDLKVITDDTKKNVSVIHIQKGTKPDIDSYSAFWDNMKLSETKLNQQLKEKNVDKVFVTGIATDWCVYSTAIHALEYGYQTFIVEDACRGVDEKVIAERLRDFRRKHGHVIQSNQVNEYI